MKELPIYLEPWAAKRALEGRFRFVTLLGAAANRLGYRAQIYPHSPLSDLAIDPQDEAPALYWRTRPASRGGRVFREAWQAPFWRIEQTYERWTWQIAGTRFEEDTVDGKEAQRFCKRHRERLDLQPAIGSATVIALQAELLRHRDFQTMSPLDMIRDVAAKAEGPVRVVLHPKGRLTADERNAVNRLTKDRRITLHDGPTAPFLPDAGRFVTQNSTTTLEALLSGLPCTLYAKSDFHHIATTLDDAPSKNRTEAFIFWFLTTQSIRAGQDNAVDQIAQRLSDLGL